MAEYTRAVEQERLRRIRQEQLQHQLELEQHQQPMMQLQGEYQQAPLLPPLQKMQPQIPLDSEPFDLTADNSRETNDSLNETL